MRIPSGSDYFGQRVQETDRSLGVPDIGSEQRGVEVAEKLRGVAAAGLDIGVNEMLHEDRMRAIADIAKQKAAEESLKKAQEKLEKARREREHSEIQTQVINYKMGISGLAREVFDDPEIPEQQKFAEFEKRAAELKSKTSQAFTIDGESKAHLLEPIHAEAMYAATEKLADLHARNMTDRARANGIGTIDALEKKAAISPKDRREAIALLDAADLYGFSEQEKTNIKQQFREKTAVNEIVNRLNANDYEGALKDLETKDSSGAPTYLPDLDPHDRERYIGIIKTGIEQEKRRKEAETRALQREWEQDTREMLSDYSDAKQSGVPIAPKDEIALYRRVKGTKYEKRFLTIKQKGESLAFITKKLAEDPLTFGAARLGYEVPPLNLADVRGLPEQLRQRADVGKVVRQANSLPYTPVLTADEAKYFTQYLKTQQSGSVQTIEQLTTVVGQDAVMGIARQVAAEDMEAGTIIGLTVQGKRNIAVGIIEGNRYIKEKALKLPQEDKLRGKYNDWTQDAFRGLPNLDNAHYQSFRSLYAYAAARKGILDGELDEDTARETFRLIVGEVVKVNGKHVLLPEDYSEWQFKDSIKRITPQSIRAQGGALGMSDEAAAELISSNDTQWELSGRQGVYLPVVNGKYLATADGRNYIQFYFSGEPMRGKNESRTRTLQRQEEDLRNWHSGARVIF